MAATEVQVFRAWVFLPCSILACLRVFAFELLRVHFDTHAFLLVSNLFEGADVVRGTLLQAFVAGNHDGSGVEVALQTSRLLVVFTSRAWSCLRVAERGKEKERNEERSNGGTEEERFFTGQADTFAGANVRGKGVGLRRSK